MSRLISLRSRRALALAKRIVLAPSCQRSAVGDRSGGGQRVLPGATRNPCLGQR